MVRTKLGQNFLVDENIARKLVGFACLEAGDTVVEIGPGRGMLTRFIQPKVKRLLAVEIDPELCEELDDRFCVHGNVEVINRDFLEWEPGSGDTVKYIGNLPYCSATQIMQRIFRLGNWRLAVLTLQKEVADRILAKPGTGEYGLLSIIVQYHASAKKAGKITPGCFRPRPKVDSTVITLERKEAGFPAEFYGRLFGVVSAAFKNRRKTVYNSLLLNLGVNGVPASGLKDTLARSLEACGIPPEERAENITLEKYIALAKELTARALTPAAVGRALFEI
jgi:16S rRNA (adenine1518-N6/adenine1519-N6)-dimethyltransferase